MDDLDEGHKHHFHAFGPVRRVNGNIDDWFKEYHQNYYGRPPASGVDCCATDTVSFHYIEGPESRIIHAVLANPAKYKGMTRAERHDAWPEQGEVSGYSETPELEDDAAWKLLTETISVAELSRSCGGTT